MVGNSMFNVVLSYMSPLELANLRASSFEDGTVPHSAAKGPGDPGAAGRS